MTNEYLEAAELIAQMAEEYSDDQDLCNFLRAGVSKIMKAAREEDKIMIKTAYKTDSQLNLNLE